MIAHLLIVFALLTGDDGAAKQLFEAGSQAYDQGRYLLAIDAFEEAHKKAPRAVTAFSAAQAHRLQYFIDGNPRQLERAVDLYRSYLAMAPDGNRRDHASEHLATLVPILERLRKDGALGGPSAKPEKARTQVIVSSRTTGAQVRVDGGEAEPTPASFAVAPGPHRIEVSAPEYVPQTVETVAVEGSPVAINVALEPQPGLVTVDAPAGSAVSLDGKLVGTAPLPRPIEVSAGHHTLAVSSRGHRVFLRDLDVGRGAKLDVPVHLERTAQRIVSSGLIVLAGALVVSSAVTFSLAAHDQSQASTIYDTWKAGQISSAEAQTFAGYVADRDVLTRAGIATAAVGLGVGVLGLVLYAVDRPEAPAAVVTPVVSRDLTGLAISGRF